MKKKTLLGILSILIVVISLFIVKQSVGLHKEVKNFKIPTKETRHLGEMSTYKWITVKKISKKLNVSTEEIFKALEIKPHPGDENMDIRDLGRKYNKSLDEMKKNLSKIIGPEGKRP